MVEKIKIKYFNPQLKRLEKIAKGSWIDLRAAEDVVLKAGEWKLVPLGIAMELPVGYEALIVPRSSTFKNFGVLQINHIGVIDGIAVTENGVPIEGTGYCGDNDQWYFGAYAVRDTNIKMNDRICQFRIQKMQPEIEFEEVETLGNLDRGGIGSTGVR